MGRRAMAAGLGLVFLSGCFMDARSLALFSNPKLKVKKTIFGFSAEAGTDFNGDIDATYDPVTGAITIKGKISSDASGVVKAEGERADHLKALMEIQEKRLEHLDDAVTADIKAITEMTAALGPVFTGMIGKGGGAPPGADPIAAVLALWGSLSESDRVSVLSKLAGTEVAPPGLGP